MSSQPIKAASNEFNIESFYLIQSNGKDKRCVVSLRDKVRIRTLLAGFINQAKNDIQIKIRDYDNPENPIEFSGSLVKSELHEHMKKHEDVIFHNGFHDLMLRIPETGDYVAFDEHGLIFIYTNQDYSEILKNLKAEYKPNEKLIYEFNHWHYCLPKGREKLAEMIKDFELEKE
jgi:hypothetical protein